MRKILAILVTVSLVTGWTLPSAAADPAGNPLARLEFTTDNDLGLPVLTNFSLAGLPLAALFDLGAQALVVGSPAFEAFGLHVQHRSEAVSAAGVRYSVPASVITLTAPGTNRTATLDIVANDALLDLDPAFDCIFPRSLVRTDRLVMLLSRGEIYLYDEPCPALPFAPRFAEQLPAVSAVSVWETGSGLMVPVIVDGADLYFFKLDTGASYSSVNAALADTHPGFLKAAGGLDSVIVSHGQTTLRRRLEVVAGFHVVAHNGQLPLAGMVLSEDLTPPPALPAPRAGETWPNFMAPAGTLGMDFLGSFDFAIDFEQHVLLLWNPADTPVIFSR